MKGNLAISHSIHGVREQVRHWREAGMRIGLVATMGNLHEGHLDLFNTIDAHCDRVVCSIFANPLQFGPNDDFDKYPRTLDADIAKLSSIAADFLFAPSVSEMYGESGMSDTKVSVKRLNSRYCGAFRDGHFVGVATVVAKLFNIVTPHVAVFGEKDFQQLAVIRQMVMDLSMPVDIVGSPTYREPSGLAYSSRNQYLTHQQRENQAPRLYQTLQSAKQAIEAGERSYKNIETTGMSLLSEAGFVPDYLKVADAGTLDAATAESERLVILVAAQLGKARLIDNLQLTTRQSDTEPPQH